MKTAAGILLVLILAITIGRQEKDICVVLIIVACCMVTMTAMSYLRPILDFLYHLQSLGEFQENTFEILLKIVGIGFLTEIVSMICNDAGNSSLGKSLQIMASISILNLSLPLFEVLLDMIQNILGEL